MPNWVERIGLAVAKFNSYTDRSSEVLAAATYHKGIVKIVLECRSDGREKFGLLQITGPDSFIKTRLSTVEMLNFIIELEKVKVEIENNV